MKFKIYYRPHLYTAAFALCQTLRGMGHATDLVTDIDPHDDALYFIYCAFIPQQMPARYIVMQTEVIGSHWFNDSYKQRLQNALAVWDYSADNTPAYTNLQKQISIVRPGFFPRYEKTVAKTYDAIFYGAINDRRRTILNALQGQLNVTVVENLYGEELYKMLSAAKFVLNLKFYSHAPLETYRIHECAMLGVPVISEYGDGWERYNETTLFFKEPREVAACAKKVRPELVTDNEHVFGNIHQVVNALQFLRG